MFGSEMNTFKFWFNFEIFIQDFSYCGKRLMQINVLANISRYKVFTVFIGFHKVIVGICFFQLVAGQKFTFQSVEFKDDCTTALVSFEVDSKESFLFGWFVVHEDVSTQIGTIFLSSTGRVKFFRNDNKFFSPDVYEFRSSPKYLLSPSIRDPFISTLIITNLDVKWN